MATFSLRCVVVLAATAIASLAQAQQPGTGDTIVARLEGVKHVGVRTDQRSGGVFLSIYTAEQQQRNVEELRTYRAAVEEYGRVSQALNEKLQQARERNASAAEQAAIAEERSRARRLLKPSQFAQGTSLQDVLRVGQDYLEVQSVEDRGLTTIIPLNRIERIYTARTSPKEGDKTPAER